MSETPDCLNCFAHPHFPWQCNLHFKLVPGRNCPYVHLAEKDAELERLREALDEIELKSIAAANSRDPRLHSPGLRVVANIARAALNEGGE